MKISYGDKFIAGLCAAICVIGVAALLITFNPTGVNEFLLEIWIGIKMIFGAALSLGILYAVIRIRQAGRYRIVRDRGGDGTVRAIIQIPTRAAAGQIVQIAPIAESSPLDAMRARQSEIRMLRDLLQLGKVVDANTPEVEDEWVYLDADGNEIDPAEVPQIAPPAYPDPSDFADMLRFWRPSPDEIFLMNTVDGPVTEKLGRTHHIGLAGPTGAGKTNIFRLLLAQTLACDAIVSLANPNYAPIKINESSVEDWRPIAARLGRPVARHMEDIIELLEESVAELDLRREAQQHSARPFQPRYYAFGEWPAIVSMVLAKKGKKEADRIVLLMGRLLREARQYGIFVLSEFQDALVQTIGGNSGLRENYRTVYYLGGDGTTAKALLDLRNGESIDETGLGSLGAAMLRCQSSPLARGRVPFFSNRALYMLLGTPAIPLPDRVSELSPEMLDQIASEREIDTDPLLPRASNQEDGDIYGSRREAAQEAGGSRGSNAEQPTDFTVIKELREIGKRLKKGEDKTAIIKSYGLPWGRATQELSAVIDMVQAQLEQEEA